MDLLRVSLLRRSALLILLAALLGAALQTGSASAATVAGCERPAAGQASCDARFLIRREVAHRPRHLRLTGAAFAKATASAGTPAYFQAAYDLTALSATQGSQDTIAVVDAGGDAAVASDLATYRSFYKLPACTAADGCLRILNQDGQSTPLPADDASWAAETTMDLEAISAICPLCHIDLVQADSANSADLGAAVQTALDLGAQQLSLSWSIVAGNSPFSASLTTTLSAATATPGAPAVLAATGDLGEIRGANNAYPAALPGVTAVGGSTLTDQLGAARGVSETAWSGAGFGCDAAEASLPGQPTSACSGRAYADISAEADPATGLNVYDAALGGWVLGGGTSLATPMVAAFEALTGVAHTTSTWAYADAATLNHLSGGYAGRTGTGTISGDLVTGAPGLAAAIHGRAGARQVRLSTGVYTNGLPTRIHAIIVGGGRSSTVTLAAGTGAQLTSLRLSGLKAGHTYSIQIVASNARGTVQSPSLSVSTAA